MIIVSEKDTQARAGVIKKKKPMEEMVRMKTLTSTFPQRPLCNKRNEMIFIQIESWLL